MPIYNTTGGAAPPHSALAAFTAPQQNAAFSPPMSQAVQAPAAPLPAGQASGFGGLPLPTSVQGHQGGLVNSPGASPLHGLGAFSNPSFLQNIQSALMRNDNGAETMSGFGGGQSGFGAFGGKSSGAAPSIAGGLSGFGSK
jgi:hypothetical protein